MTIQRMEGESFEDYKKRCREETLRKRGYAPVPEAGQPKVRHIVNRKDRRRQERDPRYRLFLKRNTVIRTKPSDSPVVAGTVKDGTTGDVSVVKEDAPRRSGLVHIEDESGPYPVEVNGEVQSGKVGE